MLAKIIENLAISLKEIAPEVVRENFQFPGKFGDVSCNIAFASAKKSGKNPIVYSEELSKQIESNLPTVIEKVEAKGGYLNFFLDYSQLFETILKGEEIKPTGKKVLVEFSNPNPCKAMHIGHARTTLLGDSISEIIEFRGNEVVRANYYNDLGKQFAKAVFAVNKYGLDQNKKPDHALADIYVQLHKDIKIHPEFEKEIQEILNRLEQRDPTLNDLRERVLNDATRGFEQTYKRLGVKFDINFFESNYREKGKEIAKLLEKKGYAFYSDEGTLVANLEKSGLPNTVLLRSDGTGLYITSDLALTIQRFDKYKLDECVWVVGCDQNLYFQQLFKIFEILGYEFSKNCRHMSYGMVTLQGSKMSSRAGEFILLDELIDEVIEKARDEVKKRHEDYDEKEIEKIASQIGVGALKYEILKVDRNRNVDFNPAKAVQFEGNTGPYIQYMTVRCGAILKKAPQKCSDLDFSKYDPIEPEKNLLRKFMEFGIVTQKSAEQLRPSSVCNYAFELATIFSQFYENCKVIGTPEEPYRLLLVRKTKDTLEKCLELLRIEMPDRM